MYKQSFKVRNTHLEDRLIRFQEIQELFFPLQFLHSEDRGNWHNVALNPAIKEVTLYAAIPVSIKGDLSCGIEEWEVTRKAQDCGETDIVCPFLHQIFTPPANLKTGYTSFRITLNCGNAEQRPLVSRLQIEIDKRAEVEDVIKKWSLKYAYMTKAIHGCVQNVDIEGYERAMVEHASQIICNYFENLRMQK